MKVTGPRVTFQVRLEAAIHARLLEIAEDEQRSLNGQINYALERWLKLQPRRGSVGTPWSQPLTYGRKK